MNENNREEERKKEIKFANTKFMKSTKRNKLKMINKCICITISYLFLSLELMRSILKKQKQENKKRKHIDRQTHKHSVVSFHFCFECKTVVKPTFIQIIMFLYFF